MFCGKCGKEIVATAKFCRYCGEAVSQQGEAVVQPVEQQVQPVPENKSAKKAKKNESKKKGKKGLVITLAVLGFVVVAAVGVGLFVINTPKFKYDRKVAKAEKYFEEENYKEALEAYLSAEDILESDGELEDGICECYLMLAKESLANSDFAAALNYYEEVLSYGKDKKASRGRLEALAGLGGQQYDQGKYDEAAESFKEVLEEQPDNEAALSGMADIYLVWANEAASAENYEEAFGYYEQARPYHMDEPSIYLGEARIYLAQDAVPEAMAVLEAGVNYCGAQDAFIEKAQDILENTVIVSESCSYSNGDTSECSYEYDEAGNRIKTTCYNTYGSSYWCKNEYDEAGNMVKEIWQYTDGSGAEYYYDAEGKFLRVTYCSYDGIREEREYYYDAGGNSVFTVYSGKMWNCEYDSAGNLTRVYDYDDNAEYTFNYDSEGNLTGSTYYDNGYSHETGYTYDAAGNRISESYWNSNGYGDEYAYEYDEAGNRTKEAYWDSDGYSWQSIYEYDEAGNRTKEAYWDSTGDSWQSIYEYDEAGNRLKESYEDSNGFGYQYLYDYDTNQNMLSSNYTTTDGEYDSCVYEYDTDGRLIRLTRLNSYGSDEEEVYEYNFAGVQVYHNSYSSNGGNYYSYYNALGDIVESGDGFDTSTWNYVYDYIQK